MDCIGALQTLHPRQIVQLSPSNRIVSGSNFDKHAKLIHCIFSSYIDIGDNINFDAAPVVNHPVFSFRVIAAWIGKKPTGDQFVTPTGAPTHALSLPWPVSF